MKELTQETRVRLKDGREGIIASPVYKNGEGKDIVDVDVEKFDIQPCLVENLIILDTDYKRLYERASELLLLVLTDSTSENEYDRDIHNFLKENNQLPESHQTFYNDAE